MGCCLSVESANSPSRSEIATSKNTTSPMHPVVGAKRGAANDHKEVDVKKLVFEKETLSNTPIVSNIVVDKEKAIVSSGISNVKVESPVPSNAKSIWKAREEESKKLKEKSERKPSPQKKSVPMTNDSTASTEIKSNLSTRISNLDTSKIMNQYKTYPSSKPTGNTEIITSISNRSTQSESSDTNDDFRNLTLSRASIAGRPSSVDSGGEIGSSSSRRKNPTKKSFIMSSSDLDAVAEFTASMKNSDTSLNQATTVIGTSATDIISAKPIQAAAASDGNVTANTLKVPSKLDISKLLDKKRRIDPVGLIKAQSKGTLGEFLADDLRAAGFNPNAISFG